MNLINYILYLLQEQDYLQKVKSIRLQWELQAEKIEKDYNNINARNTSAGAAGATAGAAVATLGPTAAMGIATTFGVSSTGTAISTLSGAAATNAALAWLGGGALAAGGGGMAAGRLLLMLAGPVGWAIEGVSLMASGVLVWKNISDRNRVISIYEAVYKRDTYSYRLAKVELEEKIKRIKEENRLLREAIGDIKSYGQDYSSMSEKQRHSLGAYVNLMFSSMQLLINPIKGLLPKYTETDFNEYCDYVYSVQGEEAIRWYFENKEMLIFLANYFYKINMDEKDQKLIYKSLKSNKEFLEARDIKKKDFPPVVIPIVHAALEFKNDQRLEKERE